MGRLLLQVAMACIFGASAMGFALEGLSASRIELSDAQTGGPADAPEPCEEAPSCDEESSDDDAATQLRVGNDSLRVAPSLSRSDGQLPNSYPPSPLFRPPIG